ncbi:DUF4302 domain-containing protein [Flavobacterium sp. TMP13]|uniref:DUF4302 domain-containing protein n=1 Tax=unclassified Flavobacterium TaxID=196869 RepID=UPI00076D0344|nr:DUF4302 domain-containing protein [Flavobacterium sp. TAB 87]KVV14172.1 hypothetical protein AP058_02058 [Flavobacterium sp. TAB 87]
MKAKNILKYLIVSFLILQLTSCTNNDAEQKFDQSPTERLNAQQKELKDLLLSSEFGWKAVYFTDDSQLGGYTHLFKFAADGTVQMASDFDEDTSVLKSQYEIQLGSTVSLVFTTKSRIHLLSDSNSYPTAALRSKGYLGDFQFLYYGQETNTILFKTNRENKELRFVKATADDWTNLSKNIDMIDNVVGSDSRPLFRLLETNDGKTVHQFDFAFDKNTRYAEANSIEEGYPVTYDMGIGYTADGIIVSPPVVVADQKLTNFIYNEAEGSFTATGTGGVSATIRYSSKPLVLTDDYKALLEGNKQAVYGYIAANLYNASTTSSLFKQLINKVNATLPANQSVSRVQLVFNNAVNGSYIQYQFNGGKPSIVHFVTTTEDAANKTLILTDDGWTQSAANRAFLKDLDAELTNPKGLYVKKENFKVTYSNVIYTFTSASSSFRMTTYTL